jgi:hypothetical protein
MDRAVANGHLAVAQWLHSNTDAGGCSTHSVDTAATNGHLELLQWLTSKDLFEWSVFAMDGAAENGHLDVVKWLRGRNKGCSKHALRWAVGNGHLEVARWLYDSYHFDLNATFCGSAWTAVESGHLHSLEWLDEHAPAAFSEHNMGTAAKRGHFDVVKWLHEHRGEGCTEMAPLLHVATSISFSFFTHTTRTNSPQP